MNILYDLSSFQAGFSGGGEYSKRMLLELVKTSNVNVFGLIDESLPFHPVNKSFVESLDIPLLNLKVDIQQVVVKYAIDKLYISLQSALCKYKLDHVTCKIIVTIHDLRTHELVLNNIRGQLVYNGFYPRIKQFVARVFPSLTYYWAAKTIDLDLLMRENVYITTVSEYSKAAILYYYPELREKVIPVFYPPLKHISVQQKEIKNECLKKLIVSKTKYILLVSGGTPEKNADTFIRVFKKIRHLYPDFSCLITGWRKDSSDKQFNYVQYLSPSDLEFAYKHAHILVYPTYQEGFGYPPLEAMKYGVPCCVSNVTSLPEVYGDSVVYFSPFYEADLFQKIIYAINNVDILKEKSYTKYGEICEKQNHDLKMLIDHILSI